METEGDALLAAQRVAAPASAAMLLDIKGIGPEFAAAFTHNPKILCADDAKIMVIGRLQPPALIAVDQIPDLGLE